MQVDRVDPDVAGVALAHVAHGPGHRIRRVRRSGGIDSDIEDLKIRKWGDRSSDDVDRPRLVVVVVELVGIVEIELAREQVLEDGVVGVAPRRDVVRARFDLAGDP